MERTLSFTRCSSDLSSSRIVKILITKTWITLTHKDASTATKGGVKAASPVPSVVPARPNPSHRGRQTDSAGAVKGSVGANYTNLHHSETVCEFLCKVTR